MLMLEVTEQLYLTPYVAVAAIVSVIAASSVSSRSPCPPWRLTPSSPLASSSASRVKPSACAGGPIPCQC